MGASVINVPIPIKDRMVGFVMNGKIWLFADHIYNPSYWLILKREGFSGNIAYSSAELTYDIYNFDRDDLAEIYRIHHGEHPNNKNHWQLHFEVEHLILSGRIKVFVLELDLITRVGDPFDPLMNESQGFYDSGTPIIATRNQLAEELGKIIGTRWLGKDNADQLHWDRSVIARAMIERYDVRAAVVETAVDFVVGLWEIGKFVVTLAAGVAEFRLQIITKAVTGDFEGIKDQLLQLGIDSVNSVEDAISKAKQGFEILQRINDDPQSKALLYDFFDSLYQSIHYRDTRTIGIRIITVIGIEVLIGLATAGAGNVARIAAMNTAKLARGTAGAAKHIGPFTLKSIDLLGDLAKRLKSNTKIPDEQLELPPVEPIKVPESGKLGVDKSGPEVRLEKAPERVRNMADSQTDSITGAQWNQYLSEKFGADSVQWDWPKNDGFVYGADRIDSLETGQLIGRVGSERGTFVSPLGTKPEGLSLRPGTDTSVLNVYRVIDVDNARIGPAAPAFDMPGYGEQIKLPVSVKDLVKNGQLERVIK